MIEHLRPYEKYKDSGQDWAGQIPAHWDVKRGRAAYRKRAVPNTDLQEKTVLSLSYGRIKIKPVLKQHGLVPRSYETHQIVEAGNIIIRGTDLQNDKTSLRIGLAQNRGVISSAYLCLETRNGVSPEFGYQLLNAFDLTKAIYRYGSGLRQNLDFGDIKGLPIFLPPETEQNAIVRFLAHANNRFDSFIATKRKIIALLNEQKMVVINNFVTRGLKSRNDLRDSGISWLPQIPRHWAVLRSKYLFREVDDRSESGAETHLSMSQRRGLVPNREIEERRLISSSYVGAKLCSRGDLVLNRLKAHLGVFASAPQAGLVSPDYTVFRPIRRLDIRYYEALYKSPASRVELRQRVKGIVQGFWRLYTSDFYDIRVPVPPEEEQTEIMNSLDLELGGQNRAIAQAESEIALVQEYRARLTADIVTGKLDVHEIAATLPELKIPPSAISAAEEAEVEDGDE